MQLGMMCYSLGCGWVFLILGFGKQPEMETFKVYKQEMLLTRC